MLLLQAATIKKNNPLRHCGCDV